MNSADRRVIEMISEDREVLEMANAPRERMERMERAARAARGRRVMRWAKRQEAKARWMHIRKRVVQAAAAAGIVLIFTALCCICVVA